MKSPESDSPIWPLLRLVVVALVTILAVSTGYREGWVTRSDLPIVLTIAGSLIGFDTVKFLSTKK